MGKTVIVTGANGMIGNAVARAFVRAGWTAFGLVRKESAVEALAADEIRPLLGSPSDLWFLEKLHATTKTLDVIVSVTEDLNNYLPHFEDTMNLIRTLSVTSNQEGTRPLVLFTSGCKDYGMSSSLHGSPGLEPHTEESPIKAPEMLRPRAENAPKVFEYPELFDGAVLRPTTIYGLSGSYYGILFDFAEEAAKGGILILSAPPTSILHGCHVDDCAEAYVALAEHEDRQAVAGQCFNISGRQYETLEHVANSLVKEYDISGGVKFVESTPNDAVELDNLVIKFPQWVSSDKIRKLTGWEDKRPLFTEGVHVYRASFEALAARGDQNVARTRGMVQMLRTQKGPSSRSA
ncbi:hypothetical protein N7448_003095 [Penicillium atrosanguineum]|nr:hypothetical protein N7448_003095 [Penicillium atrosanguineum]